MDFTKLFVSIDWDYCVPIDIINDWGHNESYMFIYLIWNMRKYMYQEDGKIKMTNLSEIEIPPFDIPLFKSKRMSVAESHSSAYDCFKSKISKNDHILLIHYDLHHDIWTPHSEHILAENWLFQLIKQTECKWSVNHIYPKWKNEFGYSKDPFNEEKYVSLLKKECNNLISWKIVESFETSKIIDQLFLCRSGAWIPPSVDEQFRQYAYSYFRKSNLSFAQTYDNPLDPRHYQQFDPNNQMNETMQKLNHSNE